MNDSDEKLLALFLERWEEHLWRGQNLPASELAKNHPRLIDELARRIKGLSTVAIVGEPIEDDVLLDYGLDDAPPPPPPLYTLIADRYRLDAQIVHNAFARVFLAFDTKLHRTVSVTLSESIIPNHAWRVARLQHESIVPIFDVGLESGTCFIVSEYMEGGSLAGRFMRGFIKPAEALRWAMEIGQALTYAHLRGIAHLDIEPENLRLDTHGRVKIANLGITRAPGEEDRGFPLLRALSSYSSPEQRKGKPADYRSDIYSLAVVIHEALSGDIPLPSPDSFGLLERIDLAPLSPAKTLPAEVRRVFSKALAENPDQRHASAEEFSTALKRAWVRSRCRFYLLRIVVGLVLLGWAMAARNASLK